MVNSSIGFGVEFGNAERFFFSHYDPQRKTAVILRGDYQGGFYPAGNRFACIFGRGTGYFTLGALVAHELIGHGAPEANGRPPASHRKAIRIENRYHAARDQLRRCY